MDTDAKRGWALAAAIVLVPILLFVVLGFVGVFNDEIEDVFCCAGTSIEAPGPVP